MIKTIADNWNQVSVDQYQRLAGLTLQDNLPEIASILLNEPIEEVEKYSIPTFTEVLKSLDWISKSPDESSYKKVITVGEKEYSLIKLSSLSIREWIDLMALVKDADKNLVKIMSILYKDDQGDRSSGLEQSMITDLYGALVFFCHIESEYYRIMQISFQNQTKMKTRLMKTQRLTRFFRGLNLRIRSRRVVT